SGTYVVQDYDLAMKFIVSARGLTSGWTAHTTFTDGNATAQGTVVSAAAGNPPISGATVQCIAGCNNISITTTNGTGSYSLTFQFGGNGPTSITLQASAPGFTSQSITLTNVTKGQTRTNVNFVLTPTFRNTSTTVSCTPNPTVVGGGVSCTSTVS